MIKAVLLEDAPTQIHLDEYAGGREVLRYSDDWACHLSSKPAGTCARAKSAQSGQTPSSCAAHLQISPVAAVLPLHVGAPAVLRTEGQRQLRTLCMEGPAASLWRGRSARDINLGGFARA